MDPTLFDEPGWLTGAGRQAYDPLFGLCVERGGGKGERGQASPLHAHCGLRQASRKCMDLEVLLPPCLLPSKTRPYVAWHC